LSIPTPELIRNCRRCAHEIPPEFLVCEKCHALVHSDELERLAATAKALEAKGQLREAREEWLSGLPLLPRMSKQATWIQDHARDLDARAEHLQPVKPPSDTKWAQRLGPLGPIAIVLAKSKSLLVAIFKLKFLLSFAAFFGFYWAMFGMKFGLGFALLILIHEMGHFVDIKRRGLPGEMPVFLPGLGAYVRWQALGVSLETRAAISLAGPLAGLIAALICAVLWWQTGNPLWAALARAGAWLNLLNLMPVWVLDGGQAALALNKNQRMILLTASLALWLVFRESIFFLLAIGAGYQAFFAGDLPPYASRSTIVYFLAVMAGLGVVLWFMPGQGFGAR
jgi:Zn-dependent protease